MDSICIPSNVQISRNLTETVKTIERPKKQPGNEFHLGSWLITHIRDQIKVYKLTIKWKDNKNLKKCSVCLFKYSYSLTLYNENDYD